MNTNTGEIYHNDKEVNEALRKGVPPEYIRRVPGTEVDRVLGMSRKERRLFYKKNHKKLGVTWDQFSAS